jgi:hypothetical protein
LTKVDGFPFAAALFEMLDFCLAHICWMSCVVLQFRRYVFGMSNGEGFFKVIESNKGISSQSW